MAICSKDIFLLKKINKSANFWQKNNQKIFTPNIDIDLSQTDTLNFANHDITIIPTPGHTPGSISLYIQNLTTLFSGDTLFSDGIGRTDLSYSEPDKMNQSLKKLYSLPKNTLIYPGHGSKFYLADLF